MAYEIPQQLQHKEKIIFGLTFSQLAWAAIWGTIVLIVITGNGDLTTKFAVAIIPSILGILFVFFDVSTWIKENLLFSKI